MQPLVPNYVTPWSRSAVSSTICGSSLGS